MGYGIRGITHKWLSSYLNNRFQYVTINDTQSYLRRVTCGMPQGSVLGPKLFILYINDICTVSSILKFVTFADDTNLFCSVEKELILNSNKLILKKWFNRNKLSLNQDKAKFMVFGSSSVNSEIKQHLDGPEIERVYETKFMGVIVFYKLCWRPHIEYIKSKIAKSLGILYKIRDILMWICLEVWGNIYKNNQNNK